jgi:hypothetical protein
MSRAIGGGDQARAEVDAYMKTADLQTVVSEAVNILVATRPLHALGGLIDALRSVQDGRGAREGHVCVTIRADVVPYDGGRLLLTIRATSPSHAATSESTFRCVPTQCFDDVCERIHSWADAATRLIARAGAISVASSGGAAIDLAKADDALLTLQQEQAQLSMAAPAACGGEAGADPSSRVALSAAAEVLPLFARCASVALLQLAAAMRGSPLEAYLAQACCPRGYVPAAAELAVRGALLHSTQLASTLSQSLGSTALTPAAAADASFLPPPRLAFALLAGGAAAPWSWLPLRGVHACFDAEGETAGSAAVSGSSDDATAVLGAPRLRSALSGASPARTFAGDFGSDSKGGASPAVGAAAGAGASPARARSVTIAAHAVAAGGATSHARLPSPTATGAAASSSLLRRPQGGSSADEQRAALRRTHAAALQLQQALCGRLAVLQRQWQAAAVAAASGPGIPSLPLAFASAVASPLAGGPHVRLAADGAVALAAQGLLLPSVAASRQPSLDDVLRCVSEAAGAAAASPAAAGAGAWRSTGAGTAEALPPRLSLLLDVHAGAGMAVGPADSGSLAAVSAAAWPGSGAAPSPTLAAAPVAGKAGSARASVSLSKPPVSGASAGAAAAGGAKPGGKADKGAAAALPAGALPLEQPVWSADPSAVDTQGEPEPSMPDGPAPTAVRPATASSTEGGVVTPVSARAGAPPPAAGAAASAPKVGTAATPAKGSAASAAAAATAAATAAAASAATAASAPPQRLFDWNCARSGRVALGLLATACVDEAAPATHGASASAATSAAAAGSSTGAPRPAPASPRKSGPSAAFPATPAGVAAAGVRAGGDGAPHSVFLQQICGLPASAAAGAPVGPAAAASSDLAAALQASVLPVPGASLSACLGDLDTPLAASACAGAGGASVAVRLLQHRHVLRCIAEAYSPLAQAAANAGLGVAAGDAAPPPGTAASNARPVTAAATAGAAALGAAKSPGSARGPRPGSASSPAAPAGATAAAGSGEAGPPPGSARGATRPGTTATAAAAAAAAAAPSPAQPARSGSPTRLMSAQSGPAREAHAAPGTAAEAAEGACGGDDASGAAGQAAASVCYIDPVAPADTAALAAVAAPFAARAGSSGWAAPSSPKPGFQPGAAAADIAGPASASGSGGYRPFDVASSWAQHHLLQLLHPTHGTHAAGAAAAAPSELELALRQLVGVPGSATSGGGSLEALMAASRPSRFGPQLEAALLQRLRGTDAASHAAVPSAGTGGAAAQPRTGLLPSNAAPLSESALPASPAAAGGLHVLRLAELPCASAFITLVRGILAADGRGHTIAAGKLHQHQHARGKAHATAADAGQQHPRFLVDVRGQAPAAWLLTATASLPGYGPDSAAAASHACPGAGGGSDPAVVASALIRALCSLVGSANVTVLLPAPDQAFVGRFLSALSPALEAV